MTNTQTKEIKTGAFALAVTIGLLGLSMSASAVVLNPASGQVALPAVVTEQAGTIVADTGLVPFSTALYTGSVHELVVKTTSGTLDFYFQMVNNVGSTASLHRLTISDFSNYTVDAFYDARPGTIFDTNPIPGGIIPGGLLPNATSGDHLTGREGGTIAPTTVDRSAGPFATIGFNFPNPPPATNSNLGPNKTSKWLVLRTNATSFGPGIAGVINGITSNLNLLAPVPEPTTALFAVAMIGVVATNKFRNRRSQVSA